MVQFTGTPNYQKGRGGRKPIAIVNHITAGLMPGCLSWMRNPVAKASAHYLVTKTGEIFQLVKDEDTAWHAGIVNRPSWQLYDGTNPNRYTIGIEHECISGGALTAEQYKSSLWLHEHLINKHGILISKDCIIGHCHIDSINRPNDPGTYFPWDNLFRDLLKGAINMALEDWMVDGGRTALKSLEKKGLVFNIEQWSTEDNLGSPTPQYLFWMLLDRVSEQEWLSRKG